MNYDDNLDPVTRYLMTYIDSVERGEPAPDPGQLSPADRAEVDDLITGFGDFSAEVDVAIPPIEESRFAIEHGIVESPPWICVHGAALRREREAAGLDAAIIVMGVVKRECGVDRGPGQHNGHHSQNELRGLLRLDSELHHNGCATRERTEVGHDEDKEAPVVLPRRLTADVVDPA